MANNKIITSAIGLSHLVFGALILFYLFFVVSFIHSILAPELYQQVILTQSFKAGWGINHIRICTDCATPTDIVLGNLENSMRLWLFLRGSVFFVLACLITHKIRQILRSIRQLQTFYASNITHFKILAGYGAVAFVFSTFNCFWQAGAVSWHFTFPLGWLVFSAACLVLSEIFKEGKLLVEDNASIV